MSSKKIEEYVFSRGGEDPTLVRGVCYEPSFFFESLKALD
jgi:hypothetical protein